MAIALPTLPRRVAPPIDRRSLPAFALVAAQVVTIAALIAASGFGYDGRDIDTVAALLTFVVLTGFGLRRLGVTRLATAIEAMALIVASGMAVACLSMLAASRPAPLIDPWLDAADTILMPFLSWRGMALGLAHYPHVIEAMCTIYSTLLWQPFVLVTLLALTGREGMAWRFVHTWLLALVITMAVFVITPGLTAYVYYGITSDQMPGLTVNAGWRPAEIIGRLRDGSLHTITTGSMTGLISFPSFHAAGAVLLGWGFRRVPLIGMGFVALDALMLLTIPLVGSHFFVEVLAGIVVAGIAIAATRRPDGRQAV